MGTTRAGAASLRPFLLPSFTHPLELAALPKEEAYPRSETRYDYLRSELLEWLMGR